MLFLKQPTKTFNVHNSALKCNSVINNQFSLLFVHCFWCLSTSRPLNVCLFMIASTIFSLIFWLLGFLQNTLATQISLVMTPAHLEVFIQRNFNSNFDDEEALTVTNNCFYDVSISFLPISTVDFSTLLNANCFHVIYTRKGEARCCVDTAHFTHMNRNEMK